MEHLKRCSECGNMLRKEGPPEDPVWRCFGVVLLPEEAQLIEEAMRCAKLGDISMLDLALKAIRCEA